MNFRTIIGSAAEKEIRKLPSILIPSVCGSIKKLNTQPRPKGVKKLQGGKGWRIRVGDWRIIYEIDTKEKVIRIKHIRHRSEIHKRLTR